MDAFEAVKLEVVFSCQLPCGRDERSLGVSLTAPPHAPQAFPAHRQNSVPPTREFADRLRQQSGFLLVLEQLSINSNHQVMESLEVCGSTWGLLISVVPVRVTVGAGLAGQTRPCPVPSRLR